MKNIELLAPAGAMPQLEAAVASGADAVYLGAPEFSARAGAGNFTFEELEQAVRYCHERGVKVHCALNTLIKENELERAATAAKEVYRRGADALIVQDLGLADHLREILPDIELHASTQMTVTSLEGVRYLEERGFSRVVLARELSYEELREIADGAKAELEVFVHGAICMCYSGQCLMSSILGGRSGNRGRCAQPCRLKYSISSNPRDEAYVLSPKDMALIDHLERLREIGIASLKIEGRLKSPEYVSAVTGVYRKYLDTPAKVTKEDVTELRNAFSRSGFTDGYFTGRLGRSMMSHTNPANNSANVFTPEAKARAAGRTNRRVAVSIFASLAEGEPLSVTMYDNDGNCVTAQSGARAERARIRALDSAELKERLSKLGATAFEATEVYAEVGEGITLAAREINETRRAAAEKLAEARGTVVARRVREKPIPFKTAGVGGELYLTAEVLNAAQGKAVLAAGGVRRIFAPAKVAAELIPLSGKTEIVTKTADIFTPEQIATDAVSVSSPAALRYYGDNARYGDFRLNVYNSLTANALSYLKCVTLSPELNLREIAEAVAHIPDTETEIIGYGRIPLMIMRNCPLKAMGYCQKGRRKYGLRDRKGMEFPILCSEGCRAILLNSKPIFAADIIESIRKTKINCIRLNFTVENSGQCGKIVYGYRLAVDGKPVPTPEVNTFTRGHLRRGVL